MDVAGQVPQADGSDGEILDQAADSGHLDDITDGNRIFQKNKDAGDDVLNKLLGAETDSKADNAGTGQQGADVDAELGKHDHDDHDGQNDHQHFAHQRQQGANAGSVSRRVFGFL